MGPATSSLEQEGHQGTVAQRGKVLFYAIRDHNYLPISFLFCGQGKPRALLSVY